VGDAAAALKELENTIINTEGGLGEGKDHEKEEEGHI